MGKSNGKKLAENRRLMKSGNTILSQRDTKKRKTFLLTTFHQILQVLLLLLLQRKTRIEKLFCKYLLRFESRIPFQRKHRELFLLYPEIKDWISKLTKSLFDGFDNMFPQIGKRSRSSMFEKNK